MEYQLFAPIWHFHPRELCFPITVEQYLACARIRGLADTIENFAQWVAATPANEQAATTLFLPDGPAASVMTDSRVLGDAPVPVYVSQFADGDSTYINYNLFYAHNPAVQTVFGACCGYPECCACCGQHYADLEHVQVHIRDGRVQRVYFAKHSGGAWRDVAADHLEMTGDRVHVYVALRSHASYETAGVQWRWGGVVPDFTSDAGVCAKASRILPIAGAAAYQGSWGDGAVSGMPVRAYYSAPETDAPWRCA